MMWVAGLILICCSAVLSLAGPVSGQGRGLKSVRLATGQEVELYAASYALVIGVKSYEYWDRLINPVSDAHQVGEALERQGFEVTRLDDPDAASLKAGLNQFAYGEAGQNREARVVVFFAGHGHTEESATGPRGFILPRDAPNPAQDRVGFMAKAVSMDQVEELATGMLAKHVLFIFDSCFSGTLLRGSAHPQPITEKTTKMVRQFITSGSANQQVPDESDFKVSLLNALAGDADQTGDGYVTGEELGWYLKGKVMQYSRGAQTPQYGKIHDPNLDQGDMVFVPGPVKGAQHPPPPVTQPPAVVLGHLQVNVNAPNSEVYVDGALRGGASPMQPAEFANLGLGSFQVRVTAAGYQAQSTTANVQSGEWTQLVVALVPVVGQVPRSTSSHSKDAGDVRDTTLVLADGSRYVGQYLDGKMTGQGTFYHSPEGEYAGDRYEGQFMEGQFHGQGTYYFADGTVTSGKWEHGHYNYTIESSNLLIDEMRSSVDSLQHVDEKLIASMNRLNRLTREVTSSHSKDASPSAGGTVERRGEMVYVAAGSFEMGASKMGSWAAAEPVHTVALDGYYIDTYEVTNAQYEAYVTTGRGAASKFAEDSHFNAAEQPVVGVSWFDAEGYCGWAGLRLPTEAEWEKAARGTDGRTYPWGNETATCSRAVMDDGRAGCGTPTALPVGSKPHGVSPYGAHDLAGNVWEWVSDWHGSYPSVTVSNPTGPLDGSLRVLRGGSWGNGAGYLRAANRRRNTPTTRFSTLGFRCARSVD